MFMLENYLKKTLPNYVSHPLQPKFWFRYNLKRLQRFTVHFLVIFFCQLVAIGFSSVSAPPSPLYAPMGVAFVMLYWFGFFSIFALVCAGITAYLLYGFSWFLILSYLLADIIPSCVMIFLCEDRFASENPNINQWKEWLRFICAIGITCLFSAGLRMFPIFLMGEKLTFASVFYHFIALWLACLNGVLALFPFAINWLYLAYSRERIIPDAKQKKVSIGLFLVCLGLSLVFFKSTFFYYGLLAAMLFSVRLAYQCGILFGSLLLYCIAFLYYAHATIHKEWLWFHLGGKLYTLVSVLLFLYTIILLRGANVGKRVK